VLTALVGIFVTQNASAFEFGTPSSEHPHRSRQDFALEFRFGPYRPNVDKEPALQDAGKTPFADTFGKKQRLMIGAEFDWQTYRIPGVGTIGPGIGVGYIKMSREAKTLSGEESGDTMSLGIVPMWLVGVLRADVLWRSFGAPIVPYGKAGLGYAFWWAPNTSGVPKVNSVRGRGGSFGTQFALGLAFALDALDPSAARTMDITTGVNNTYLFAEWYWLTLNGFGSDSALHVGANTWTAGLAFEF
jgi:hypothetical protein